MNDKTYKGQRIAKWLARAGVASRRGAERLIDQGKVRVDGQVLKSPAFNVTGKEDIRVDGRIIGQPDEPKLWRYYKKKGLVTTAHDPEGRATVFDNLPSHLPRVITIGRLDVNTEGLLLLTNDGELARELELPSTGWVRRYRVRAFGEADIKALEKLKNGTTVEGVKYGPIEAEIERVKGKNVWLNIALREGKNREVKRVLGAMGLQVNRLIRVSFGPFTLHGMEPGVVVQVPRKTLREQLGGTWKKKLGGKGKTHAHNRRKT